MGHSKSVTNKNMSAHDKNLSLPCRENVVSLQVNTLLQIVGCLGSFIANTRIDDNIPQGGANDGGARMAAEAVFSKVCSRLDTIVEDNTRWDMQLQNTLEKTLLLAYQENIEALRATTYAAKKQIAPSTRFHPNLLFLPNLGWCAILGDVNNLESAVIGYGATPEQAMESFDMNFLAGPPDAAAVLAATHEKAVVAGEVPLPPPAIAAPIKKKRKK